MLKRGYKKGSKNNGKPCPNGAETEPKDPSKGAETPQRGAEGRANGRKDRKKNMLKAKPEKRRAYLEISAESILKP